MRKLTLFLLAIAILLSGAAPAAAATDGSHDEHLRVYYAGPAGGVRTALDLAPEFEVVDDVSQADVLVLNGVIPDPAALRRQLEAGAGLVLVLGPELTAAHIETLIGSPLTLAQRSEALSLVEVRGLNDPLLEQVVWNSSPQVRERYTIEDPQGIFEPLVNGFEDASLVIGHTRRGPRPAFLIAPFLDGYNPQFQTWAYFNYLIYHLTARAGGVTPDTFADYPGSPVPHTRERLVLFALLSAALLTAAVIFVFVRRYSLAHPEALDDLVADQAEFTARQAGTGWEEIGFHRPLGGFMLAFMLGLVLFVPLIIYQNMILPVFILPSAQALGIWGRVVQFFEFLWLMLDLGTSAAFIKFFAQYRVHDPRRAIQYGQVFVWWQALSGAVQVAIMTAMGGFLVPQTVYALYAWSIIIHTFIQIPGFFMVMRHALMGWQRFDYAQILDMGWKLVFPMITQPVLVLLMVYWSRSHPVFGTAMGGLLGLGLAAYASEALTFLLGLFLYRRMGYNARLLFMAHFDWSIIKTAFKFGGFEMLGSVAWAVGQAIEILITQTRLVNYTEIWGNWVLAQNFVFAFSVLATLFNNVMPSISEAISNARVVLSQYYSAMSYKWGGLISAFIGALLLAVADRFILGASGPEFVRAAGYAVPLIIWGAFQYPSWVGDNVQLASNRPYLKAAMVFGEQVVRIALAWALLERFQINALIFAYFIGLFAKGIAAYFVNHRLCYPQRFYFWQSLAAPLLAGAAHYQVVRWLTGLIWQGDQITSVLIFFIGILPSYPLFAFFYGLFGGWDDPTLSEVHRSARLSGFMRPLVWLFWAASRLGARLSPLHGRFPITIRDQALKEAHSLSQERVELV